MPENIDQLPQRLSDDLDRRLDHFDSAWNDGSQPDIEAYIPKPLRSEKIPPRPQWRRYVAELLSVDLEHRLRNPAGDTPARIEDYFDRIRWLPDDELVLLELIPAEFMQRHQRGDPVDVTEYLERFPQLGSVVTECLKEASTELVRERSTPPPTRNVDEPGLAADFNVSPADTIGTSPRIESDTTAPESHGLSRNFGNYELDREIARGGMGIVYKATQRSLKRTVALKVILAGDFAQTEDVRRFRAEAEAAAKLDHPNIVPIFEVGEEAGHHYFSMAYIKGPTLTTLVANHPMGPAKAALVMRDVADAIQYAHDNGIIHRDLKPSNIMLEHGRTPRVTDFGLARQTNVDSGMTVTGQVLGTPSYMPPEQALGHVERIDARSDVYSLGATLYYLIAGRAPFSSASAIQTLAQVVQDDPLPPRRLNNDIPRDLENICLKCLNKSPDGRYQTAAELQADLDRFLAGVPTIARPLSLIGRMVRFCRRKPGVAASLASVVTIVTLAYIVTLGALKQEQHARKDAQNQSRVAQEQTERAEQAEVEANSQAELARGERDRADAQAKLAQAAEQREKSARQEVEANLRLAEFNIYLNGIQRVQQSWSEGHIDEAQYLLTSLRHDLTHWDELHGWEYNWEYDHISGFLQQKESRVISDAHQRPILTVCWSPDGTRIASAGQDEFIKVWDRSTRRLLASLKVDDAWVRRIRFVGGGSRLLSISDDGTARLWNTDKRALIAVVGSESNNLTAAAISPDGNRWVWSDAQGRITVSELGSKNPLLQWQDPDARITALTFDAAGVKIAAADAHAQAITVRLVAEDPETVALANEEGSTFALAFSADGKRLATAGSSGWVQVWNIATGQRTSRWPASRGSIYGLQFGHESDQLLTSSEDQTIRLWSISRQAALDTFRGHHGTVFTVQMRPTGAEILSAGDDGTLRLWSPGRDQITLNGLSNMNAVAPSADGTGLQYPVEGVLRQLSFSADVPPADVPLFSGTADGLRACTNPAGAVIVSAGGELRLCSDAGETLKTFAVSDVDLKAFCQSSDGQLLAASDGRNVKMYEMASGAMAWQQSYDGNLAAMQFTFDDGRLIVIDIDGTLRMIDARSGESTLAKTRSDNVCALCVSPQSPLMAVGENDGSIRLYDDSLTPTGLLSGHQSALLRGHQKSVNDLAFSPDGRRIASAGTDGTVRIWSTDQQALLLTLSDHEHPVRHVFWTEEGRSLVSVDEGGRAIRWRTDAGAK